jgi:hypothetical protein
LSTSETTWFSANRFVAMRFSLQAAAQFVRAKAGCTVASGNIEIAIGLVNQTVPDTFTVQKVSTSGVVACPSPSSNSITVPLSGPAVLGPGHYVLMLWADNTTVTFSHYLTNAMTRSGASLADSGVAAGGIPGTYTAIGYSGRGACIALQGV